MDGDPHDDFPLLDDPEETTTGPQITGDDNTNAGYPTGALHDALDETKQEVAAAVAEEVAPSAHEHGNDGQVAKDDDDDDEYQEFGNDEVDDDGMPTAEERSEYHNDDTTQEALEALEQYEQLRPKTGSLQVDGLRDHDLAAYAVPGPNTVPKSEAEWLKYYGFEGGENNEGQANDSSDRHGDGHADADDANVKQVSEDRGPVRDARLVDENYDTNSSSEKEAPEVTEVNEDDIQISEEFEDDGEDFEGFEDDDISTPAGTLSSARSAYLQRLGAQIANNAFAPRTEHELSDIQSNGPVASAMSRSQLPSAGLNFTGTPSGPLESRPLPEVEAIEMAKHIISELARAQAKRIALQYAKATAQIVQLKAQLNAQIIAQQAPAPAPAPAPTSILAPATAKASDLQPAPPGFPAPAAASAPPAKPRANRKRAFREMHALDPEGTNIVEGRRVRRTRNS